ncbi:MAG: calcium-binding protein [Gemmataceae bacterium]
MTSFNTTRRPNQGSRRRSGQVRQLPPRRLPQLLHLEERTTPSVTLSGYDAGTGQVIFTGDNNADSLVLARVETYPGSGSYVLQHNVSGGGLASFIDMNPGLAGDQVLQLGAGTNKNITVTLGDGDDVLILDDSWAFNHKVTYAGGTGTNEVVGTAAGKTWTISNIATGAGNLGGAGVVDFSGVNTLTAGAGADTLVGEDAARTWNLGASQVMTDGSHPVTFSGMDTLQGGTDVDTFNVQVSTAINIKGGAGNDVVAFKLASGDPVLLTGAIDGEAGTDTLNYTNYSTTDVVVVELTGLGGVDGFAGTEVSISGSFTNIDAISAGANDANSIKGLDDEGTWTVGGAEQYFSINTLSLAGIANMLGGSDIDTFNVGGAHSGNVDGGAGADVFNFTAGTLTGDAIGGDGNDDFNFSGGSVDGNVTGNAGADTFDVTAAATVSGGLSGGDDVDDFNIVNATLTGSIDAGAGADTVDLTGAGRVTGNIVAGTEDDVITLAGTSSVGGTIAGGAGTDTLSFAGSTNARTVTLSALGVTDGFNGSETDVVGFSDINILVGSSNTDTLIGMNAVATWDVDGTNTYTSTNILAFSAMENLTGGSAVDTFNVTANHAGNLSGMSGADEFYLSNGATLTGNISGGAGADVVSLADTAAVVGAVAGGADSDTLTYASFTAAITMTVSGSDADGYSGTGNALTSFSGINVLTGTAGTDAMVSDANAAGAFVVSSANAGTFTYTGANGGAGTLAFSAMENLTGDDAVADTFDVGAAINILTGGTGDDVFNINAGGSAASIVAGAGNDTLSYASRGGDASVTVASSTADGYGGSGSGVTAFTGINAVTGSVASDTLISDAGKAGFFVVNAANAGTFTYTDKDPDAGLLTFSAMDNLTGDSEADEFKVTLAGSLAGTIDGAGGTDVLTFAGSTGARTITLTGLGVTDGYTGSEALVGGFTNVDTLVGSSNVDTLIGRDVEATWTVNGTYTYNSGSRDITFSAIENLTGGSDIDTFNLSADHGGNVSGMGGADVMSLTADADLTGNLAGGDGGDSISLAGTSSVTGAVTGDAGNDSFAMADTAMVTGTMAGGAGTDSLSYANYTNAVSVILTGPAVADGYLGMATGVTGGIATMDSIAGRTAGAGSDILKGEQVASTWTLGATNTYKETSGVANTLEFANFEALVGGAAADAFVVNNNAFTGSIDGGVGANSVSYAGNGSAVEVNISGTNAGTVTGAFSFTNLGSWVGSAQADTFNFTSNAAKVTGSINGGAGDDSLSYSGYTSAVRVNLNTGVATGAASIASFVNVTGGSGNDTLIGNGEANMLTGGDGNDTVVGNAGADSLGGGVGNDILIGGADADTLTGGANDDILIGGSTTYDANISALNAIMAEWGRSDVAYATKVARINGTATGGLNGSFRFNDAAITDDVEDTSLLGGDGVDWFLASILAEVDDQNTGGFEIVTTVS